MQDTTNAIIERGTSEHFGLDELIKNEQEEDERDSDVHNEDESLA